MKIELKPKSLFLPKITNNIEERVLDMTFHGRIDYMNCLTTKIRNLSGHTSKYKYFLTIVKRNCAIPTKEL